MAELTQSKPIEQATLEELTTEIAELEEYRNRLVQDTLDAAKRAKVMKAKAQSNLEPVLTNIDVMLEELHQRHTALLPQD
ncbi:MAG: hypothetical protein F6K42_18940 [Leptolyngbya sp. SIO1D8]|nr:hypothetical protein [Leptolyngbya sp. SIO1D8]